MTPPSGPYTPYYPRGKATVKKECRQQQILVMLCAVGQRRESRSWRATDIADTMSGDHRR
jgi:hypothetical protein